MISIGDIGRIARPNGSGRHWQGLLVRDRDFRIAALSDSPGY
jgi:hypothetical protein